MKCFLTKTVKQLPVSPNTSGSQINFLK